MNDRFRRKRSTWGFGRAASCVLLIAALTVVMPIASPLVENAAAQGAWINGPTVTTSEGWQAYSGWSWPSWQIAGGGDAGFRATTYLRYPDAIRAGQSFQYQRCMTSASVNETNIYEVGMNAASLDGSTVGFGTVYSQGGWAAAGASVCRTYTATAPTAGLNKTVNVPQAWVQGSQAVGYAGSCCGGYDWRAFGYTPNNSFVTNVYTAPAAVNDGPYGVPVGGTVDALVLANDTGFSGATGGTATGLSVTVQGTKGSCLISGTKIVYVSDGVSTGADQCTYSVNQAQTDNVAPSNAAVTAIAYFNIAQPPVAVGDTVVISEDGPAATIDPRTNDSDPAGGSLTVVGVNTSGTQGTVLFTGTSVTYDPGSIFQSLQVGQTASTTFTYTIQSTTGLQSTATVTVTINGANDAPVAVNDSTTTGEDGPTVTIDPRPNDTDVDSGDTKTVTAVDTTGTQGTVSFTGSSVSYTPSGYQGLAAGQTATTSFKYTVADSQGATSTATVLVTVVGSNDAPVANADTGSVSEDGPAVGVSPLGNDTDVDAGDVLSLVSATLASGTGTVSTAGNTVTYNPNGTYERLSVGDTATVLITYVVRDVAGATATNTITVTVNGANDAPTAIDDAASVNAAGPAVGIEVLDVGVDDSDPDQNDVLSVSAVGVASAGTATLAGNTVTYDPGTAFVGLGVGQTGTATFTYDISDGQGGTDTATVTVTVFGANDAPTPVDDTATVPEDGPAVDVSVLANDTDPDTGDSVSIQSAGTASHGTVTWSGGSTISYLPNTAFYHYLAVGETATDTFTYTVVDMHSSITTATVTVTITGVNDAPVAVDDVDTTDEDTALTVDVVAPNDTDVDTSDVLAISAVTQPPTGGTVTFAGNDITFDPAGAYEDLAVGETRDAVFTYTIDDGNGGTDTATVTVTVTGVNDAPVAVDDVDTTDEDTALTVDVVAPNDTDVDVSDVLAISAVTQPATGGTVTFVGNEVTFDPAGAYEDLAVGETRDAVFTYTIDDGNGGTDTATVTVTVTGVNDAPVAVDDAGTTDEDTALTVDVVAPNDTDVDTSDVLAISAVTQPGSGGTVTFVGNEVTFDPAGAYEDLAVGETRDAVFTYTIDDGNGGTDTATVTVTVTGVNDAPVAVDDVDTTDEDTALTVDVVAPNDTDVDLSDVLAITAVTQPPTGGTVTFAGNEVTFDPAGAYEDLAVGETRDAVFTYDISDGNGGTATASVTVTVTGVNDAPTATDNAGTTDEDTPVSISVLSAGIADSDPDTSDVLSIESVDTTGTVGSVTIVGADVVYDPGTGFQYLAVGESATTTFTYTISDGHGGTATATVTITVTGVNDAPVAVDDAGTTPEATPLTIDVVTPNDTDVDVSDDLNIIVVTQPAAGGTVIASGKSITFDPSNAYNDLAVGETRDAVFTYTISDGNGGTDTATVTITVTGSNGAPNAVDDAGTTDEATAVTIDVVAPNDTDVDASDVLAISAVTQPAAGGTVTFAGNEVTFDPAGAYEDLAVGETRDAVFTYTISDGNGGTDTATVTVTVAGVNDNPVAVDDVAATTDTATVTVDVVAPNDSDVDGSDTLSIVSIDTAGLLGTATFAGNEITYDPSGVWNQIGSSLAMLLFDDQTSVQTLTYVIDDGHGATATATVTITVTGTLSHTADGDGGGVPDWIELIMGTDPADPSDDPLWVDTDGGGVPDWIEYIMGTDPTDPSDDPLDVDTDGGGVPDWIEYLMETDPTNPADDPLSVDDEGNGVPDWHEIFVCGSVGCEELPPAPTTCPKANDLLELVSGELKPGKTVSVKGHEPWLKFSDVVYYVCSAPTKLTSVGAGSDGLALASATIPADLAPGTHVLFGLGLDADGSEAIKAIGFTVDKVVEPTTTTVAPTTTTVKTEVRAAVQRPIAKTGGRVLLPVLLGAVLFELGLAFVLIGRRRRSVKRS